MAHDDLRTSDGLKLFGRHWANVAGAPRGTVLLVHGLGEHCGRHEALAQDLNAAGWHVRAYDHRGHGQSEGQRGVIAAADSLLQDLAAVLRHMRCPAAPSLAPGPLVMLGHSMGGAVAARFMAPGADGGVGEPSWRDAACGVDALVLSSPALRLPMNSAQRLLLAATANTVPNIALGNGLKPEWICSDPRVVAAYKADPLVHDRISPRLVRFMIDAGQTVRERAAQWHVPTLLMWAGADRCVDPAGCAELGALAPDGVLSHRAWDAMSHEIFNEPQRGAVVQALLSWLEARKVPQQAALN